MVSALKALVFERAPGYMKIGWCYLSNWLRLHLSFLKAKFVHVFLFVVVNILIGSLGVWMPMLMAFLVEDAHFRDELSRSLAAAGPYTFAVAYLAATTAYIAYEYLEGNTTRKRKLKTTIATTAFVLIILCTLLSAFQTQISELSQKAANNLATQSQASVMQPGNLPQQKAANGNEKPELSIAEELQLYLVVISVVVGLLLYVISRWDDADALLMIENYESSIKTGIQQLKAPSAKKRNILV